MKTKLQSTLLKTKTKTTKLNEINSTSKLENYSVYTWRIMMIPPTLNSVHCALLDCLTSGSYSIRIFCLPLPTTDLRNPLVPFFHECLSY